ncbi:MAG: hypothetical protein HQM16_10160 [Deltaproteobacteria bacterium]|nr:hypothetical protein [Deltaproteobacteria bacterium]
MDKIIGGILILAGGIYVIHKTKVCNKIGEKAKRMGGIIKDSFIEGYTAVVRAA